MRIELGLEQASGILRRMLELGFNASLRPVRGLAGEVVDVGVVFVPPDDVHVDGPYRLTIDGETRARGYKLDLSPDGSYTGEWRYLYLIIPSPSNRPAVLKWTRPGWM